MLKASKIKLYRVYHNISLKSMGYSLNLSSEYLRSLENFSKYVTLKIENTFFQTYESKFNRVDKEIFKERYPYENIKLLGDSSIKTLKKERS